MIAIHNDEKITINSDTELFKQAFLNALKTEKSIAVIADNKYLDHKEKVNNADTTIAFGFGVLNHLNKKTNGDMHHVKLHTFSINDFAPSSYKMPNQVPFFLDTATIKTAKERIKNYLALCGVVDKESADNFTQGFNHLINIDKAPTEIVITVVPNFDKVSHLLPFAYTENVNLSTTLDFVIRASRLNNECVIALAISVANTYTEARSHVYIEFPFTDFMLACFA